MTNTTNCTTNRTTAKGLRVKSRVKAGGPGMQHNQAAKGLRVKSRVKAGGGSGIFNNHNQVAMRRVAE